MSEFGGFRKRENNPACTKNTRAVASLPESGERRAENGAVYNSNRKTINQSMDRDGSLDPSAEREEQGRREAGEGNLGMQWDRGGMDPL